ncbi:uncharacterized protein LOC100686198 isoform X11 [Canis lupus familiaris]|uniref:uncharacterized protein LOC100686198 isoform X11 n=2 Tax=Canis lupus familiaris TaxID=9615 RepID=UPI0018F5136B|nr:uncharacterized protein LOC100686198 isoform X11 [Canis lupus familiaris]XP_038290046.1 uncharacterized protein LOC100686198 isoform X11 [Canis lupus familiaris]XP_038290053.1 uncharacterized protein LOC100686198 isoform X11 [Canis lupus familiaris]XP_038290057.1 uncharacterized protein LOC100686198 isoform X11 [Canis lupus familiaris]
MQSLNKKAQTTNNTFAQDMNSSSENSAHGEGGTARPFFYVHAVGPPPYPSPWYQNLPANPCCVPGAGFRNGSLYFPYSVVLSEYPGFLIPQSPLPTAFYRRPMFCNTAQFRQCSGYGQKTNTKETQTEPHQAENMTQKQDTHSEGDRVTSILTSNIDTKAGKPEATGRVLSSVVQKEPHPESPSPNIVYRISPQGHYVPEKAKTRPEQSKGCPVTQFWKTLKETIRLYNLTYGKTMPENLVQHSGISQSPCESRSVLYNRHEGADSITGKDDESTIWSKQCHDVKHDEVVKSGSIRDMNLGKEKGCAAVPQFLSSPGEAKDRDEIQDTLNSSLCQSSRDGNQLQQERPFCSSNKAIEDLSLQSKSQSPISFGENMPDNGSGGHGLLVKVDEGEVVEMHSCPQSYVPPPTSLAQFSQVSEGIQCDMSQWQDAEHEQSPESSPESRKTSEEGAVRCGELDEVVVRDGFPKYVPNPAWLAQMNKGVDAGIQCDGSWWQDAELEKSPDQMPSKDEESSPACKTEGSQGKTIRTGELNTDEEMTRKDETEEEEHENFKKCADIQKSVTGRKQTSLSNFSSGNTGYLVRENAASNTVLLEDSEDCDFEEEVEGEMEELDCLFAEVSPLGPVASSKGQIYHKAGRIIRMPPECCLPSQLLMWPTRNKNRLKHGEYESIPVVCKVTGQDGRFRGECTTAMQEGLESKRASHKSWERNCQRWKTKVPYKVSNRFEADAVKFRK